MTRTCALVFLLWSGGGDATYAQGRLDFALVVTAPTEVGCTPSSGLEQAIEARVERLVFLGNAEPARRILVKVAPDPVAATWHAEIVMHDERGEVAGERRISTPAGACAELDEALIVVISTLIGVADPLPASASAAREESEPRVESNSSVTTNERAEAARNESGTTPERTLRIEQPSVPEGPRVPTELSWDLAGRGDIGYLPGLALGLATALQVDFGAWGMALGARYWPYTHRELGLGASATLWSLAADASLCFEAGHALATTLSVCGGVEGGFIRVIVTGLGKNHNPIAPSVRAHFGPSARVALSSTLGLVFDVNAVLPLSTPRYFFIESSGERRYYHSVGLGISVAAGGYWLFSS